MNNWCNKCGEPIPDCDGRQWCSAARHRSNVKYFEERAIVSIHSPTHDRYLPDAKISSIVVDDSFLGSLLSC